MTRALLVLLLLAGPARAQTGITTTTLGPGLHVLAGYANGNILVVDTPDGVLLVDAQSARRVAAADTALRALTPRAVRRVIYTHYHEDHVAGTPHWRRDGLSVLAHEAVPTQMRKDTVIADWDNWHRKPAAAEALPDAVFSADTVLSHGGIEVRVLHIANAHTDGDAIVYLPRENVLHVGDLVEPGAAPFIDWWAGGSLSGMIAGADRILGLADSATRIVPGHGPVIGRAEVMTHRRMLQTVGDRVAAAVRDGHTVEQLLETNPASEFEDFLGGPRRAQQFVRLLYYGATRR